LDLNAFIEKRRERWIALERLLERIEAGGMRSLRHATLDPRAACSALGAARNLAELYRGACADLVRARTESANAELIGYLNDLVGRAYGVIYRGRRRFGLAPVVSFLLLGFPARVRARAGTVAAAAGFLLLGLVTGFVGETLDSSAKHYLLPSALTKIEEEIGKSPAATGGTALTPSRSLLFSTGIITNNAYVSLAAFALGATGGLGTAVLLFYNGALVGDLAAIFARAELSLPFWALILPHGVIELAAIFIAGAAGFLVGRALVAPGEEGRRAALLSLGREAVELVLGCAVLLVLAGAIEGFVTPRPDIAETVKIAFGLATGVALLVYLAFNERILASLGVLDRIAP
jgi:uncharacterized membrane protein SpoIIM required for sporulation